MSRNDPLRNVRFRVEIDGVEAAGFSEVSGLNAETEIIEYRQGTEHTTVRKLPGLTKFANVTLKRGITDSMELWEWRKAIMDGDIQRRTVRITLLDEAGDDRASFLIRRAWPAKYEASDLDASGNEVAIETLELAHEGLERER
jgi:phage tail-like protein